MGRPHMCPYCRATRTVSKGVRKTQTMGDRRIRLCKACGRKFTPKKKKTAERAETGVAVTQEPDDRSAEAKPESSQIAEPAEALGKMFPPPGEEWTS